MYFETISMPKISLYSDLKKYYRAITIASTRSCKKKRERKSQAFGRVVVAEFAALIWLAPEPELLVRSESDDADALTPYTSARGVHGDRKSHAFGRVVAELAALIWLAPGPELHVRSESDDADPADSVHVSPRCPQRSRGRTRSREKDVVGKRTAKAPWL